MKHAVLPPVNNRPNPLVTEAVVYASVFSEGAVCALDRESGRLLWRKEIPKLGASSVHLARGTLRAKTAHTLFALEPQTGKTIWSFCPYGESGESIYSDPVIRGNRLFIGDRRGYIHCLDSRTGRTCWQRLTSTAEKRDVNSTPVIAKGLLVVGTNASRAAAYDVKTGRPVWTRKLDGPSVIGPFLLRDFVILITDSVYFLNPSSGTVVRKFSWTGDGISGADCTRRDVVCLLRGSWSPEGKTTLVSLDERGIHFTKTFAAYSGFVRYVRETRLIYVSHLEGIDVFQQADGATACKIELGSASEIGPVDVTANTIYALTGEGYVYALRHPDLNATAKS